MITIINATSKDFAKIKEIAFQTWPQTYGEILSKQQLEYMLNAFYSEEALQENVLQRGHHFDLAIEDNDALGFVSYEHNYNQNNKTKIHKIYILPNKQGKGIGKLLLDQVEKEALITGSTALLLNVNRFNKAVQFYQKVGFEIIGQEDIELDHGYLMEDFIMQKRFDN